MVSFQATEWAKCSKQSRQRVRHNAWWRWPRCSGKRSCLVARSWEQPKCCSSHLPRDLSWCSHQNHSRTQTYTILNHHRSWQIMTNHDFSEKNIWRSDIFQNSFINQFDLTSLDPAVCIFSFHWQAGDIAGGLDIPHRLHRGDHKAQDQGQEGRGIETWCALSEPRTFLQIHNHNLVYHIYLNLHIIILNL